MGHCADCGTRLEHYGCPNCSESVFLAVESDKTRWAEEDSKVYPGRG